MLSHTEENFMNRNLQNALQNDITQHVQNVNEKIFRKIGHWSAFMIWDRQTSVQSQKNVKWSMTWLGDNVDGGQPSDLDTHNL